jgi:hypothetical protein
MRPGGVKFGALRRVAKRLIRSRDPAGLVIAATAVLLMGLGLIVGVWMTYLLDRAPFRMELTPGEGQAVVRFYQPSARLQSRDFAVDLELDRPVVLTLDSADVPVPGGAIEFMDPFALPGRVKLRVGRTSFDLMESRVLVDGRPYEWEKGARRRRRAGDST